MSMGLCSDHPRGDPQPTRGLESYTNRKVIFGEENAFYGKMQLKVSLPQVKILCVGLSSSCTSLLLKSLL